MKSVDSKQVAQISANKRQTLLSCYGLAKQIGIDLCPEAAEFLGKGLEKRGSKLTGQKRRFDLEGIFKALGKEIEVSKQIGSGTADIYLPER